MYVYAQDIHCCHSDMKLLITTIAILCVCQHADLEVVTYLITGKHSLFLCTKIVVKKVLLCLFLFYNSMMDTR